MAAKALILAASLGALMTVPMLAHHSFGSEYDSKKPLKFEDAVVTKVEWTNPHARFYVDVKGRERQNHQLELRAGQPECAEAQRLDQEHLERRRQGQR